MITYVDTGDFMREYSEINALPCKVFAGSGINGGLTYYLQQEDSMIMISHNMLMHIMQYETERKPRHTIEDEIVYSHI